MKKLLRKIYWITSTQLGVDPRQLLRSLLGLPRYISEWRRFREGYQGRIELRPCLQDRLAAGGTTDEYFWQDLYIARKIFAVRPEKHVDISSRLDGFVAHVASFREIEVFDIRPITAAIPGVIFRQADLMTLPEQYLNYCDSLSCLHALEHFGLGRYGDPINPQGAELGLQNMAMMLRPGGALYLAVPIGQARVEFNANRIFAPFTLLGLAQSYGLVLQEFAFVERGQTLTVSQNPELDMRRLAAQPYALGIFIFSKSGMTK